MIKTISPTKDTEDFGDSAFYGFCFDFEGNKATRGLGIEGEMRDRKEVIMPPGEYTAEWKNAHRKYETLKGDLGRA